MQVAMAMLMSEHLRSRCLFELLVHVESPTVIMMFHLERPAKFHISAGTQPIRQHPQQPGA